MKILSYEKKSYFSLTQYSCPNEESFLLLLGEYFEGSRRFCVKCGCKTKSLDDSTSGTKKSKSLNEYVKKKIVMKKVVFSKLNFNLLRKTVKASEKSQSSKLSIRSFDKCRCN